MVNSGLKTSPRKFIIRLFPFVGGANRWWCKVVSIDVPYGLGPSVSVLELQLTYKIGLESSTLGA